MRENDAHDYSDDQLIALYLEGQEWAFVHLHGRYLPYVRGFLYKQVQSLEIAEDLVQESFLSAWKEIRQGRYSSDGRFKGWLVRIAQNKLFDEIRKRKRTAAIQPQPAGEGFQPDDPLVGVERKAKLLTVLELLEPHERHVLVLRYFDDLPWEHVATKTGQTVAAAKMQASRALKKARELHAEEGTL